MSIFYFLSDNFCVYKINVKAIFLNKILEDTSHFCRATNTPELLMILM